MSTREKLLLAALALTSALLRAVAFFRYRFDSDEPQHLHVAWGWTAGLVQYRDLFDNHAPLFHMATAPILAAVGERADALLYMRAPMLLLFAIVLYATWLLGTRLYSPRVAGWAVVLLSLLPPFFLKSLEYRTDNLWNALWMLAVIVLSSGPFNARRGLLAGAILGLAMGTSMKTSLLLITLGLAGAITMWMKGRRPAAAGSAALLAGACVAPAAIVAWFAWRGALPNLLYCNFTFNEGVSATRGAFAIWAPRMAYLPAMFVVLRIAWRNRQARADRFFWGVATAVFFVTLAGFWILISPRDYLPFLPMMAIFAVAALGRQRWALPAFAAAALLFVAFIAKATHGFEDRTREQITMMHQLLRLSRPGEPVMDLKGETIFRPRPYYYIFEFITRNLMMRGKIADTVPEDVVRKRCYIAQADGEFFPPRARAFLSANFLDLGRLRAAGQWIKDDGSFTIAVPGEYVIVSRNGLARGVVDGTALAGPVALGAGAHRFTGADAPGRLAVIWAPAIERGFSPFRLQDRDF